MNPKQTKSTNVFPNPATAQQPDSPRKADSRNGREPSELSDKASFCDAARTIL